MGKEDYDVILKSVNGTKLNGTNTNSIQFKFDWSVLEDKDYELTFNFISKAFTTTTSTVSSAITTDLVLANKYEATLNNESAQITSVLGTVASGSGSSGVSYLYSDQQTNAHIYLTGRPRQNTFNIKIIELDYTTLNVGLTTGIDWTLILHFKDATKNDK